MRPNRLILDPGACAYHCITRTVGQEFFLASEQDKEKVVAIIRAAEYLKGANALDYTIMCNHLHLIVSMPEPELLPEFTEELLIKHTTALYSNGYVTSLKRRFKRAYRQEDPEKRDAQLRQIYLKYERMRSCDLSDFMKEVKERISKYINKQYNRKGTLWEERFKSVVVENTLEALLAVSTYIDLNPVRADMVDRVEDYPWCGYSAALAGDKVAQQKLIQIYEIAQGNGGDPELPNSLKWDDIKNHYRQYLHEKGVAIEPDEASNVQGRKGLDPKYVEEVISNEGKLELHEIVRIKVRYFSDGVIFGSAKFVDDIFNKYRIQLVGRNSKRRTGSRSMGYAKWGILTNMRDLKKNVIGHSQT